MGHKSLWLMPRLCITACLLTQVCPLTFLQAAAAAGAKIPPICTFAKCVCVCVEVRVSVEETALSSPCVWAGPSLSCHHSLAPGTLHSCRGNHSAGNLRFHLSPIHSGTYLEQRCSCHEPEGRARLVFRRGGEQGVKRGRVSTGHMFGLRQ